MELADAHLHRARRFLKRVASRSSSHIAGYSNSLTTTSQSRWYGANKAHIGSWRRFGSGDYYSFLKLPAHFCMTSISKFLSQDLTCNSNKNARDSQIISEKTTENPELLQVNMKPPNLGVEEWTMFLQANQAQRKPLSTEQLSALN